MQAPRNARFWVFWNNSPVKITLRRGQSLSASYGGPTDEGWSRYSERWEYAADEDVVYSECETDGCDCDGRLTHHWEGHCLVLDLAGGHVDEDYPGVVYPAWQTANRHQRDYAAEAAGY